MSFSLEMNEFIDLYERDKIDIDYLSLNGKKVSSTKISTVLEKFYDEDVVIERDGYFQTSDDSLSGRISLGRDATSQKDTCYYLYLSDTQDNVYLFDEDYITTVYEDEYGNLYSRSEIYYCDEDGTYYWIQSDDLYDDIDDLKDEDEDEEDDIREVVDDNGDTYYFSLSKADYRELGRYDGLSYWRNSDLVLEKIDRQEERKYSLIYEKETGRGFYNLIYDYDEDKFVMLYKSNYSDEYTPYYYEV